MKRCSSGLCLTYGQQRNLKKTGWEERRKAGGRIDDLLLEDGKDTEEEFPINAFFSWQKRPQQNKVAAW